MKKTMLILICAVVIGMSAMTAAAEEREQIDQNPQEEAQTTEEENLIAPSPDSEEDGSEVPLVISPAGESEQVASSTDVEKNDLLETTGIPILGMTCIIVVATMIAVIIYKKK